MHFSFKTTARKPRGNALLWTLGFVWVFSVLILWWYFGARFMERFGYSSRRSSQLQMGSSSRDPVNPRPIPVSGQSTSIAQIQAEHLAWARRTMLDLYPTLGRRDPRWDKPVVEFIAAILPWATNDRRLPIPPLVALVESADALLAAGCDEPVFLGLAGMLKRAVNPETTEGYELLKHAVARFRDSRHLRAVARWFAGEFAASGAGRSDAERLIQEVDRLSLEWLAASLRDGSYTGEDSILVRHYIRDGGYELFQRNPESCARIIAAGGDAVPPWVKLFFTGRDVAARAWKHYRAKQQEMDAFDAGMETASVAFMASWTANPARAEAAEAMIPVASVLGLRVGSERMWFERTLAAQIDSPNAFYNLAWYYLPRWGGSHRLILDLGRECAATKRFDTLTPLHLMRALQLVDDDLGSDGRIFREPQWRKELEAVLDAYDAEPSQQTRKAYFRSLRAVVALKWADYPTAFRILQELDFRLEPEAGRWFQDMSLEYVTAQIAVFGGAQHYSLADADAAWRRGDRPAARKLLRGIIAVSPGDNGAAAARALLASMDMTERIETGRWTKFLPATTPSGLLPGWSARAGQGSMSGDGTLTGQVGGTGFLLTSDAEVGPDFDVRGELEIPSPNGEAGIAFGGREFGQDAWLSARFQRGGATTGRVVLGTQFGAQTSAPASVLERNTFVVRSWQGRITIYLNGVIVMTDATPASPISRDPDLRVGVGAAGGSGAPVEVRFRRLEIRRLRKE